MKLGFNKKLRLKLWTLCSPNTGRKLEKGKEKNHSATQTFIHPFSQTILTI